MPPMKKLLSCFPCLDRPSVDPNASSPTSSSVDVLLPDSRLPEGPIVGTASDPAAGLATSVRPIAGSLEPIRALSPFMDGWMIKGRCTFTAPRHEYENENGEGVVFSFELTDRSGSVRVVAFNRTAEIYLRRIHFDHVYTVSGATVKKIKEEHEKFKRTPFQYELVLGATSEVNEVEDDGTLPKLKYNFVKLAQLRTTEADQFVDIIGVVHSVCGAEDLLYGGKFSKKRTVYLVDDSARDDPVPLTFWREHADILTEEQASSHPVISVKCARLKNVDFCGVSLDVWLQSGPIETDPSTPEAKALREWYQSTLFGN